jgi:hypothetical protein
VPPTTASPGKKKKEKSKNLTNVDFVLELDRFSGRLDVRADRIKTIDLKKWIRKSGLPDFS